MQTPSTILKTAPEIQMLKTALRSRLCDRFFSRDVFLGEFDAFAKYLYGHGESRFYRERSALLFEM